MAKANLALFPSHQKILEHFDSQDPVIARVIREVGKFGLQSNKNYFVVLCRAIISQQISIKAAESIFKRFRIAFHGKTPTPRRVMGLGESALRGAGLSRQKISYLKDLSSKFLDKSIRSRRLTYLGNDEVIRQLTDVHGIGRWTAEMFLIFSLNRLDVLPIGDLGFRLALKNLYNMKSLPSRKRMERLGRKWHPYETIATWYAWRTQDPKIVTY